MQFDTLSRFLCHLSLIEGVGPGTINALLAILDQYSIDDFYHWNTKDFCHYAHITETKAHLVVQGLSDTALLEKEISLLEKHDIRLITIFDPEYPSLLKDIHLPPIVLYAQGASLQDYASSIAVVGSRAAGSYAQQATQVLVAPLVHAGFSIVSGGALGVDAMAHAAAVQAGGKTAVVLGSGILKAGPPTNTRLFQQILEKGGSLLSSFPMSMEASAGNFPARNRIIAGMAVGCVVIQAAQSSGARITANYALEQGKPVFAVPGSIFDPLSQGCHELIAQGATPVIAASDILAGLGSSHAAIVPAASAEPVPEVLDLSPQGKLLTLCAQPCSFDELQVHTALSFVELNDLLFGLQLEGKISQSSIGLWQRKY